MVALLLYHHRMYTLLAWFVLSTLHIYVIVRLFITFNKILSSHNTILQTEATIVAI